MRQHDENPVKRLDSDVEGMRQWAKKNDSAIINETNETEMRFRIVRTCRPPVIMKAAMRLNRRAGTLRELLLFQDQPPHCQENFAILRKLKSLFLVVQLSNVKFAGQQV
jgi:hypothetical protein